MDQPEARKDLIVEAIRKARAAHAEKFSYDLKAIVQDLKRHEQQGKREVVSFAPKRLRQAKAAP